MPVRLEGEATEVLANDGLVDPAVDTIEVVCTPRNIPDEFVIDVTDMTMDTVIRSPTSPLPAGVTATADPDMAVVTVLVMRASELETSRRRRGGGRGRGGRGRGGRGRRRRTAEAAGESGSDASS